MSDILEFDYEKASALMAKLMNKDADMRKILGSIKSNVREVVRRNWSGNSAQAFVELYGRSSDNVAKYLKSWLECSKDRIEDAKKAKQMIDNKEAEMIYKATQEI